MHSLLSVPTSIDEFQRERLAALDPAQRFAEVLAYLRSVLGGEFAGARQGLDRAIAGYWSEGTAV